MAGALGNYEEGQHAYESASARGGLSSRARQPSQQAGQLARHPGRDPPDERAGTPAENGYVVGVRVTGLLLLLALVACDAVPREQEPPEQEPVAQAEQPPAAAEPEVEVRYRVEVRTGDAATADAARVVEDTLTDPRGWSRAGFSLVRDDDPATPFVVVLAEAAEVDRLCLPYDTFGRYSCQNGPVVALNADRWRTATPEWTGDLDTYRQMLVNHEVGHLLGQHHPPSPQCPAPGELAPVMAQQSTELDGCLPNPWPLPAEVELAARHEEPLAPPFERSP